MTAGRWNHGVHLSARLLAVLVAGAGVVLLCEEGAVGGWRPLWIPGLPPQDEMLATLVLGGALLLLLGWFWEKWGTALDIALAGLGVILCITAARLHSKWPLAGVMILPIVLYLMILRGRGQSPKAGPPMR